MKVLFLDIDGVLNSREWFIVNKENIIVHGGLMHRHAEDLDPVACKLVNALCTEFSLYIVISSTWRKFHTLVEIQRMFAYRGLHAPVIGATPQLRGGFRGQEVDEWLHDNPGVTKHVILDDDGDFKPEQPLVQTNWEYGVCYRDIDKARTLLKNNS
jgi:hypothetical protein